MGILLYMIPFYKYARVQLKAMDILKNLDSQNCLPVIWHELSRDKVKIWKEGLDESRKREMKSKF